jgi:hypothetical protein
MVVIRMKDIEKNGERPVNTNSILTTLKLCKLISSDIDQKIENKISYLSNKPENKVMYYDMDDGHTIFGFHNKNTNTKRKNPRK